MPLQHALWGGESPFHLIIHHAVIRQLPVLFLQLIVPPLLHKDLGFPVNVWVQHRVQIDMHQVLEILVIGAGHRVHRLVRIRHGIEERVHGTFHQLHKGVFYRKLLGPTQNTVLQNVRHPGGIRRRRPKSDGKHLVLVIIGQQKHSGPGFLMFQKIGD